MKCVVKSHKPHSISFNVYKQFTEIIVLFLAINATVKYFFFLRENTKGNVFFLIRFVLCNGIALQILEV